MLLLVVAIHIIHQNSRIKESGSLETEIHKLAPDRPCTNIHNQSISYMTLHISQIFQLLYPLAV